MKRMMLFLFMVSFVFSLVFAQQAIYVSARGNDANDGLSEERPIKSFSSAVEQALTINGKVIVIGTITIEAVSGSGVFWIINLLNSTHEVIITGKQNATSSERAVLSARGSGGGVLSIRNRAKIRFENIEIYGGEGDPTED